MAATVMFQGNVQMQRYILGINAPNLYVGLYSALVSGGLGVNSVYGDFTFNILSGGAPISLTPATWVDGSITPNPDFTYTGISWIFAPYAGGTTIYGYVVFDNTLHVALWGEDFAAPYLVPSAGGGGVLLLEKKGGYC